MIIMDTRIREFEKIKIQKYVPELDLLNNPVLNAQEKDSRQKERNCNWYNEEIIG
jgi:hypothetical protein